MQNFVILDFRFAIAVLATCLFYRRKLKTNRVKNQIIYNLIFLSQFDDCAACRGVLPCDFIHKRTH